VQSPRATEIITRRLTEEEPGFISLVTILEVVGGAPPAWFRIGLISFDPKF
jgi:hypothetical protein